MKVLRRADELHKYLTEHKLQGISVGFVPTMGSLHQGHLSLIKKCIEQSDICVCSIFVNPTQFNDKADLIKYPRKDDEDIKMLKAAGCDMVYLPNVKDVYPNGMEISEPYNFGQLEFILEGASRPGHYQGVAQVVDRLLQVVQPDVLFLGQKDFQQVKIIKELISQKKFETKVVACPIVREKHGLAMSSRNARLSEEERQEAGLLYKTLMRCKKYYSTFTPVELRKWAIENLNSHHLIEVDYFKICNTETLEEIDTWDAAESVITLAAIFTGPVRLIDNMIIF